MVTAHCHMLSLYLPISPEHPLRSSLDFSPTKVTLPVQQQPPRFQLNRPPVLLQILLEPLLVRSADHLCLQLGYLPLESDWPSQHTGRIGSRQHLAGWCPWSALEARSGIVGMYTKSNLGSTETPYFKKLANFPCVHVEILPSTPFATKWAPMFKNPCSLAVPLIKD